MTFDAREQRSGLIRPTRRGLLKVASTSMAALALSGCDSPLQSDTARSVLAAANSLSYRAQRLLTPRNRLAPEYPESAISTMFKANGSTDPQGATYKALAKAKFVKWRLVVDGLVDRPLSLSLADIRAMPARTQITRHDCVEGWSCIGKWTGAPLSEVLASAGVKQGARFAVFHCADTSTDVNGGGSDDKDETEEAQGAQSGSGQTSGGDQTVSAAGDASSDKPVPYYESMDLVDALHPQTILAYEMNGQTLPVAHGAPLRVRVERQLGYKMAKYLMRIELVDDFAAIGKGKGGYWEDTGYDWYAGI